MGVELYLVRPDASGRVVFPFWDADGEPIGDVDYQVITSLKWVQGHPWFAAAELWHGDRPVAPDELVAGARRGLVALLAELTPLHPDFERAARDAGDDPRAIDGLLYAFETDDDWMGGDEAAWVRLRAITRGEFGAFRAFFWQVLKAGQQGYYGCWSY